MALQQYHAKRNFKLTPEPRGRTATRKAQVGLSYLIQKHAASHLHYDFRLELNGVLLSWAVPKGPSLDPADKRLAMHVEDHPMEYGGFEGIIPAGQYGGGTVMLWDTGTWSPVGDAAESYRKGHLKFELHGKKLEGIWALVKLHGNKYGGKGDPWLLIKDADAYARRGADAHVVDSEPDSVVSGRSIDEIAESGDREWHSNRSVKANVLAGAATARKAAKAATAVRKTASKQRPAGLADVAGAVRKALPATLAPALATLVKDVPTGEDWLHETKYDGYRMLTRLQNGKARMFSRNGKDWTENFSAIATELGKLKAKTAWLDGEVCAVDKNGRSDFQLLQNALSDGAEAKLVYFVFDLVYLDGYHLASAPLSERKRLLRELLGEKGKLVRYSPEVQGSGAEVFRQACPAGLEGIICKRSDSTYPVGARTRDWVKVKCSSRQEMVIGGYTDPQGSREGFGALLLGVYEGSTLRYAGKVGTGFDDKMLTGLYSKLKALAQKAAPFANPPRGFEAKGAHWVAPKLVAEIQFTEWSDAGALRHPSFLGLRQDKKALDVVREEKVAAEKTTEHPAKGAAAKSAKSAKAATKSAAGKKSLAATAQNTVAGVTLSHPEKLLFPEAGISKLDLAHYYEAIADWILPQVRKRPLSMLRCPDGWGKECFYQKHADASVNPAVTRIKVPEGNGGTADYFSADSLPALVGLVQWGVLELHPWGSSMPKPEKPDRLIFDFDPADDVSWKNLVQAANELRTLLKRLGLEGFLKTTGGKGLHVVVPIKTTLSWEQAKAFTKAIATLFTQNFPERFLAVASKSQRRGKIFIDYLRNSQGATAIAAYGVRARKNAPVSTPIAWEELAKDVRHDYFNVKTVPKRLAKLRRDPWQDFDARSQTVTAAMFAQLGIKK